jgi:hypothetical protein
MKIGSRGSWFGCTAVLAGLLAPPPARAQPAQDDQPARLAEAERACLGGNYQKGVEILAALYVVSRHPTYLHNQARCYEQNGQYRLAAGRYREFLRKLRELPPEEVTAETKVTQEKAAALEAHATRLEQMSPDRRPPAPEASAPKPAPEATVQRSPEPPPPSDRGGGWRTAGTALMVVGVMGLAGGVAAGLWVRRIEDGFSTASARGETFDAAKYRDGERAAKLATIGFVAAPMAALAGVLSYWRGASLRDRPRASLRVAPVLAGGSFGAQLALSY